MKRFIFTGHALLQMQRRAIPEDIVRKIIETPGQTEEIQPERLVF
jgi:hypothetical protein